MPTRPGPAPATLPRHVLALDLLRGTHAGRLLEVGYGDGSLLPALAAHCDHLDAVDVHGRHRRVMEALRAGGTPATLIDASVTELPHPDGSLDVVVCVAVLEHVAALPAACAELRRVLHPEGRLVVVARAPHRHGPWAGREHDVRSTLVRYFAEISTERRPRRGTWRSPGYTGSVLTRPRQDGP